MFITPKPTSLLGASSILKGEIQLEMLNGSRNELDGGLQILVLLGDTGALTLTPLVSRQQGVMPGLPPL